MGSMANREISTFQFADTTARYLCDDSGVVALELYPTSLSEKLVARRETLRGHPEIDSIPGGFAPPAAPLDPIAHVKIVGEPYPGAFAQGRTMRNAPSSRAFLYAGQDQTHEGDRTTVTTRLKNPSGCRIEHRLSWHAAEAAAEVVTVFFNDSPQPVTLELLTSFSLGGITPFHEADAARPSSRASFPFRLDRRRPPRFSEHRATAPGALVERGGRLQRAIRAGGVDAGARVVSVRRR